MSLTIDDILAQIEQGNDTTAEIAEALGYARGHTNEQLHKHLDAGRLARERDGRTYRYFPADGAGEAPDQDAEEDADDALAEFIAEREFDARTAPGQLGSVGGDEQLKPPRDYDFDEDVPDRESLPEYISADGEYERIKAAIENRQLVDHPARVRISGPQGSGKTLLPSNVAADNGWPLFVINAGEAVPSDLKGTAVMVHDGGETVTRWGDGTLTKAMLSAAKRPTLLLVDEVNRAPPEVKSPLFSALDFRGEVEIPFTGEKIRADPQNLIVVSTMNEGREFRGTHELDAAERRRISKSGKFNVDHLGVTAPEKEAMLVAANAPIARALAEEMVEAANAVRNQATHDDNSAIRQGIPTSEVISWAKVAASYDEAGIERPVLRAAEDVILGGVYEHDGGDDAPDVAEVRTVITSKFKNATPADPVAYAKHAGLVDRDADADDLDDMLGDDPDAQAFECRDCGRAWASMDAAEEAGALDDFTCPDCDVGDVVRAN